MHPRPFSSKVFVVLASLMLVGSARTAAGDTITLMWDANPEPAVTGYIVHVGTQPGAYTQHIDVGPSTGYAFATALAGQQYCFAVSAYVVGPLEGPLSVEVCGYSNRPPTLVNPGGRTSQWSQATTLQLQGVDPDGQPVSYNATGLPTGLTLQSSTGFISGAPTAAGAFTVTATVSDGMLTASQSFTWTITAPDVTVPTVAITGPTSAATYTTTTAAVTITGSAADNVAVTQVTWSNDRGGSGSASGTTSWSAANVALQAGVNILTVTARDAAGNTSIDMLTVTYTSADTMVPAVTITGPTSAVTHTMTGTSVAVSGTASDNVGVLQVTWVNNRGGSGTATGTTTWTASAVALQAGANIVTVTARDAAGNTASDVLTITVNGAPTLTNPGTPSSNLAQSTSLQLAASDPNADTLTYSITALPPGLSLTASNGLIAGTPVMTGSYPVTATVSDGTLSASQTFTWTITPNASASTGTIRLVWDANTETGIAGYVVHAGTQTGVYVQHYDVGQTTTWLFANAVFGQRYCFTVSAYLTGPVEGPTSTEACGYANVAPTLAAVANQSSNAGQAVTLQLAGSDPEGSTLTYGASGLPAGLAVTASTGLISGTPTTAGAYSVTATLSDGALTSSRAFTWTVISVDTTAPVVTITSPTSAATFTTTSSTVTVSGSASDAVGVTQVTWANDRGGSGIAAGTTAWNAGPIALQGGVNRVTVTARDAAGNVSTDVLTVTFNVAPVLAAIANQTANIGVAASLQLVGTDANGDPLSYSAAGLPPGLSLTASTGAIAGIPTAVGSYSVTATVSDGTQSASRTFVWTVAPDTTAPVVIITAPTSAASFTATTGSLPLAGTASDVLGVTQVSWVNSRGGSGVATGTSAWSLSAIALLGGQNVITVTARDAAGNTATDVITVTWNTAPILASVSHQSSEAGQPVALQLTGSDADGDALTYGANGLPPGVALTVSTGVLSGTPTEAGTYSVTATVFDGVQSATQTFAWTVTADVTRPVVAITAPTTAATYASNGSSVTLSGTASDSIGVTQVSWVNNRGGSGTATGTTSWTAAGIALQSGVNVITVAARDAAGNTTTDVLTVTYNIGDIVAPSVQITTPTSATLYQARTSAIVISGIASDNVGVTRVTWVNDRGGSGTALGTTSWSASVGVKIGANVFTVTARDAAGNTSTDVLTVHRNVAPTLASVSNRSNRIGQTVSLQLVGTDANGDELSYSATNLPTGLSLNASTGLISGSPTTMGIYTVIVSVSDGTLSRSRTFTWTIKKPL